MKKILLTLFMGVSTIAFAQETDTTNDLTTDRKHEIRLDALEALSISTIEFNYEYIISKFSGLGAAVSFRLDESDDYGSYQKFAFAPYYRQYFFNKKEYGARGLFAEGLLQVATGEDLYGDFYDGDTAIFPNNEGDDIIFPDNDRNWTNFGVGFALGQKWVSQNGFILELSVGGGRYFGGKDGSPEGFFRGGVLVGYRF